MTLEQMENALRHVERGRDTLKGRAPDPERMKRVRTIVGELLDDLEHEKVSLPWAVQSTIERLTHELGMYYPEWGKR